MFFLSPDRPPRNLHSFPTRRSSDLETGGSSLLITFDPHPLKILAPERAPRMLTTRRQKLAWRRSEEHTSELQSHHDLVCRLLLEKKKQMQIRRRMCSSAKPSRLDVA